VFALLALGFALRYARFLTPAFATELNRLVFYGALPCLLVDGISRAKIIEGTGGSALVLALSTLATAAIAWILAIPCGIPARSRPTFCQTVFRSNNAYVGLPVIAMALSGKTFESDGLAVATLTLAPCLLLYNVLAVLVLSKPSEQGASLAAKIWKSVKSLFRNPLILACLTGLGLLALKAVAGAALPKPVAETVRTFGRMATPGSLIALGASIDGRRLTASLRGACVASVFKLAICPLVGAVACYAFSLQPVHRFVVITYLCCPSAVASFVMAEAMGGDGPLAGSSVALTTILSSLSLGAAIYLFLP
jgi:predicted permease